MSDESIGREIRQLREDVKDDLGEIKARLTGLLSRELAQERHDGLVKRLDTLERDAEKQESERQATRKWAIGAIVFPLISVTVTIVLTLVR